MVIHASMDLGQLAEILAMIVGGISFLFAMKSELRVLRLKFEEHIKNHESCKFRNAPPTRPGHVSSRNFPGRIGREH